MAAVDPQRLEFELVDDLASRGDCFGDTDFAREVYRTLTNMQCSKRGWPGHISLSWRRVEDVINALRSTHGQAPLALFRSGGEGQPGPRAEQALAELGWSCRPLDTSEHDDAHVASPADPPPSDSGERHAHVDPETAHWEERAHEEAERERRRRNL